MDELSILALQAEMVKLKIELATSRIREQAAKEAESNYRAFFEHSSDGFVILDTETKRPIEFNDQACRLLGYSREDFARLKLDDIEAKETSAEIQVHFKEIIRKGYEEYSTRFKTKSGEIRDIFVLVQIIRLESRSLYCYLWRDITEQKKNEDALRESEDKFRLAFRSSPDAVTINRLDDVYVDVNEGFCRITGYSAEEILGKSSLDLQIWHEPVVRADLVKNLKEKGFLENFETTFRRKDGSLITGLMSARLITLNGVPHNIAIFRDITERKVAEEKLRTSERNLRQAQRISQTGNWKWNLCTGQVDWSEELYAIYGMTPDSPPLTPDTLLKQVHPNDVEMVRMAISQSIIEGRLADLDYRVVHPEGSIRVVQVMGTVTEYDADGRPNVLMGVIQDITERKRIEEALLESKKNFEQLFQNVADPIYITDTQGRIIAANDRACRELGYSRVEILQLHLSDIDAASEADKTFAMNLSQLANNPITFESSHRRKDGSTLPVELNVCLFDFGGRQAVMGVARNISERQRAQEELRESKEQLSLALQAGDAGLWIWNHKNNEIHFDERFHEMLGYSREELPETLENWLLYHHPQDMPEFIARTAAYQRGEVSVFESEHRIRSKAGKWNWIFSRGETVPRQSGAGLEQVIGIAINITERKDAEEALRQKEEEFRALVENAPDVISLFDRDLRRVYVNSRVRENTGLDASFMTGKSLAEAEYPDSFLQPLNAAIRNVFATGQQETIELDYEAPRGHIWLQIRCAPLHDQDGSILRVMTIGRDITGLKRAEGALRQNEERLRLFIEHAPAALAMFDLDMRYLSASRRWLNDYGLGDRDLTGLSHYEVFPEISDDWKAVHQRGLAGEVLRAEEDRFERLDGSVQWLKWEVRPWHTASSEIGGIVIFSEDVTGRKQIEETLKESERRYRMVADYTYDWEYWIKPDCTLIYTSPSCQRITGYSADEFISDPDLMKFIVHPDDQQWVHSHLRATDDQSADPYQKDYRIITQAGETRWISHYCRPIWAEDGTFLGRRASNRDISDRVAARQEKERLESQLRHVQKLEAIGTLAGGIAHDFNNILSPIIGYAEIVLEDLPQSSPSKRDLDQILTAANRAKELVKQILSFSRLGEDEPTDPLDLSLVIKEVLKLLYASLPSSIQIKQSIEKVIVLASATQIHQVIVNLCTNASHAMGDKGILEVSLHQVSMNAQELASLSLVELKTGAYARLCVADTGHGMDAETMSRIFDPYFTTKEVGKGTGLGLAVVHGIVKRHGGEIRVESELGSGTTFSIYLPIANHEVRTTHDSFQDLPKGVERILLVDDEPTIATLVERILGQIGYRVNAHTNPEEALEHFRSEPGGFDLIVTDFTMPRMTGLELAEEIIKIRSDIPIIVCTGYSERLTEEEARSIGVVGFAMKPLRKKELAELVRGVLDKKGAK